MIINIDIIFIMLQIKDEMYEFFKNETVKNAVKIGSKIREIIGNFLRKKGFVEISPVIISSITDPLAHEIIEAKIRYYGNDYYLTKSMIFHKQIALLSFDKIFSFSPNIRLELEEKRKTKRHLVEFTQVDIEARYAKREEIMKLAEEMLIHLIKEIKNCDEINKIERRLRIPLLPFKKLSFEEVYNKYGENYEEIISNKVDGPTWIVDFPIWKREFYDREYEDKKGWLVDMDLIYPEGFGEALSGGEREYEYTKILRRLSEKNESIQKYIPYLKIAKEGFYPSAGFGIGMERLVRYICGFKSIEYTSLFPKLPGKYNI